MFPKVIEYEDLEDLEKEFNSYVLCNKNNFYRFLMYYIKDENRAIHILQKSIIKAYSRLETLKGKEFLEPWVYQKIMNEYLESIKVRNNSKFKKFLSRFTENFRKEEPIVLEDIRDKIELEKEIRVPNMLEDRVNESLKTGKDCCIVHLKNIKKKSIFKDVLISLIIVIIVFFILYSQDTVLFN